MDAITRTARSVPAWIRYSVVGAGAAVLILYWLRIAKLGPAETFGDFALHWEFGRRLVDGEFIYSGGTNVPYPPFWALAHAPLSFLSAQSAQLVTYPLVVASLVGLLFVLRRLTANEFRFDSRAAFWTTALAVLFSARYLIRDLPEVGINLVLVTLSWTAVLLWTRKREWSAGLMLGLAISLKCTPALFWAWFVLKRQWKMAGITAAAVVMFSLSPIVVQGPEQFARAGSFWLRNTLNGVMTDDPSAGVLGPMQLQNMSLKGALARFLMVFPDGHPGRTDHPLYLDILNLDATTANQAIRFAIIGLVMAVAWKFRRKVTDRTNPALLRECAAVSVMILLMSPITWGQHCVGVLPSLYLMFARRMKSRKFGLGTRCLVGAWSVFVLALFGDAVGQSFSHLLQSYHVETWCIAGLLAVVLGDHSRCRALSLIAPLAGGSKPAARKPTLRKAA